MKFGLNSASSHTPADWLDRVNPFLTADDESQPVRGEDGQLTAAILPDRPCTKPCCQGES